MELQGPMEYKYEDQTVLTFSSMVARLPFRLHEESPGGVCDPDVYWSSPAVGFTACVVYDGRVGSTGPFCDTAISCEGDSIICKRGQIETTKPVVHPCR